MPAEILPDDVIERHESAGMCTPGDFYYIGTRKSYRKTTTSGDSERFLGNTVATVPREWSAKP